VSTSTILVLLGAFLASAVEMVEALTIVLGVGLLRGWRSPLIGVAAATIVLAALVATLGRCSGSCRSAPCVWSSVRSCSRSDCSGGARRSCARAGTRLFTTRTRPSARSASDYLAICDHTVSVGAVPGPDADGVRRQGEEIAEATERAGPVPAGERDRM
jgi:hypothetical protein